MDIKEIAIRISGDFGIAVRDKSIGDFAEALISAYKAELLKEVGEPVLYAEFAEDGGWLGDASEYADHIEEPHALFTSDQIAAAVLKATKPLEEKLSWLDYTEKMNKALVVEIKELHQQLQAAQEEIERIKNDSLLNEHYRLVAERESERIKTVSDNYCALLMEKNDQLAKAEQRVAEWQPISTAPKDGTFILCFVDAYMKPMVLFWDSSYWREPANMLGLKKQPTHWMPLPKAPNGASS